jgi:hypothetical protein
MPPRSARATSTSQLRRAQSAVGDPKVRLAADKRAVEAADGLHVAIAGKTFPIQDSIGMMPLMEWAAASAEVDIDNKGQLVGMFRILKDVVATEKWDEFRQYTTEKKCTPDDFVLFLNAAIEAIAARPTAEPAAS